MKLMERINTYRVIIFSVILVIVLALIEVFIKQKQVHFAFERIPSFYFFLGFFSAFIIIVIGLVMKKAGLRKDEHYYE